MPSERRRALVVGIDDYTWAPLAGCVNDANALSSLLRTHENGSPNFAVKTMTQPSHSITRSSLRSALNKLFSDHDEADIALFYFSGHGTENNFGGFIVTPDASKYDEGVSLVDVLTLANKSKARECVIILDSCHSGHLGSIPAIDNDQVHLREGVSILTAARAAQVAVETDGRGLFSELVCGALEGGAADVLGSTTVAGVYAYVDQALGPWDQRPLFRANLSKLVSLRNNPPAVAPEILRQLPAWFPTPDHMLPLDPSYEPDAEPNNKEHEQVFAHLQRCRAAKLVDPVGEEHMYFAAMNKTGCQLTPLGKHYWRLAQSGHI
jgi:caspase domain-containing protein